MPITTFIPKLWSARLLQAYEARLVFGGLVNRNYEGEIQQMGDTVHINTLNDITVKAYDRTKDIEDPDELTTTDQTLVIDQGSYYNFFVNDVDKVQAAGDLMDTAMTNAAARLAEESEDFLIGKVLSEAGIAMNGAVTKDNIWETIVSIKVAMDKAKVPQEGRHLVVTPAIEGILLTDDRFVKTAAQASQDRLVNGTVARAAGFDIYVSLSTEMKGKMVAFNTDSVTFANQLTKTEAYRPEKRFADAVRGLNVYGAKVTRPDAVLVYTVE